MSDRWCLTESDPAIFTALLTGLGVTGLQVEELWSLDNDSLDNLEPVYALIFLFKCLESQGKDRFQQAGTPETPPEGTWFAHQVITNACATLAIVNAVMNISTNSSSNSSSNVYRPQIDLGEELGQLKSFSAELDPQTRGELLGNSEKLRAVHNSFARTNPFHSDEPESSTSEDAYHFIAYIPVHGKLYELDGLKALPVSHGEIPAGIKWTEKARSVVESRINTYSAAEVHFNLMAICGDRLKVLEARLGSSQSQAGGIHGAHSAQILDEIEQEREKRRRWDFDNCIRRHNHVGLVHALMLALAKSGRLKNQVEIAKKKMTQRQAKGQGAMELDMD